jgi:hypothetical protein
MKRIGCVCHRVERANIICGQSKTPSLIFEYVNNTDFRSLYPKFTDFDVRYYIFELLKVWSSFEGSGRQSLIARRRSTSAIAKA